MYDNTVEYVTGIYRTYLSTLSHKRLSGKKEDHHGGEAVRRIQLHGYFKYSHPPRQPLRDGLIEGAYEGFYFIM